MIALQKGNTYIAKKLMAHRARINHQNVIGMSVLMVTIQKGLTNMAEVLLEHGADTYARNNEGTSVLMFAAMKGLLRVAKLLLDDYGADVNAKDGEGTTVLMAAVKNDNVETAKLLLDYGAEINVQNKNMWSALMFACHQGHIKMIKLLLEYGANVNLQKKNRWTGLMLMIAGTNASFEVADLLLKHGADMSIQGTDGWSASTLASKNQYTEIAKLLEKSETKLSVEVTVNVANSEQYFSWREYGLHLYIPENSLPKDIERCTIYIKVDITGNYQLPQDVLLVSAMYSFKCVPKCQFTKPLILEIQHCTKQEDSHKLCFIRSLYRANPSFHVVDHSKVKLVFPKHIKYGIIELDKFCDYGVGLLDSNKQLPPDQGGSNKRDYYAIVYRQCLGKLCHKIYFVILWNTSAHFKVWQEIIASYLFLVLCIVHVYN